ncbi:MAG TPA: EF-hand domain-containing protein [Allosphingosinicella sp.]
MTSKLKMGLAAAGGAAALLAGGATLYAQGAQLRGPMARFDSDANGAITLAEARAGAARMFAEADSDKDGRVTSEEMRAFHGRMGEAHHRGPHGGRDGGPPPHAERKGGPGGPMHLDSDGDGSLTLAEAQSGIERHFGAIDSNRDGSVGEAELRAAHEAHRARR